MSTIGKRVAASSANNSRMGIKARSTFGTINNKTVAHLEISKNHPSMLDPQKMGMGQQQVDIVGSRKKIDFAGPPKYRNQADPASIQAQLKMIMENPDSQMIGHIAKAIEMQQQGMSRKIPRNQMDPFQSARHRGYNQVSNIGVQMPNAPLGVPIA